MVMRKLQEAYADDSVIVDKEYAIKAVVQAAHCVGAHMDNFGACAKQQMLKLQRTGFRIYIYYLCRHNFRCIRRCYNE